MTYRSWSWAVLLGAPALASCTEPLPVCDETIPDGGCPLGRGGSCDDVLCSALYDCVAGDWTLAETCPEQGGSAAGGADAGGGDGGQGGCQVPVIDHTGETNGCEPDLQSPDCPVEAAEVCADPCLNDCIDFYLCKERGWTALAYCDDLGELVIQGESTR